MSNQKITQSALFKAILVFVSLGALILGLHLFYKLPSFGNRSSNTYQASREFSQNSLSKRQDANDIYIPKKENSKRPPIHFNAPVKNSY